MNESNLQLGDSYVGDLHYAIAYVIDLLKAIA